MRLHALAILALCAYAHSASISSTVPDKRDIEKKLTEVVKEVLSDDPKPELEVSEPLKDIENNLKSVPAKIPVKVVVEDVLPMVKSDKKENNEISQSQESDEIKREEPDLQNPGQPQHMQHDSQHPSSGDVSTKKAEAEDQWSNNPAYINLQKELQNLKSIMEAQIAELQRSLQQYWIANPNPEQNEHSIKLRSSAKQDANPTYTTPAPFWTNNPLYQGWQNLQNTWQSNFAGFNNSLNEYFSSQNQSQQCGSWNFPSLPGLNGQQGQSNSGTQSDEQRPPGLWQQVQQNVQQVQQNLQNFLSGGASAQPPSGAQSDAQQPQPARPVIQAFQSAIQQAGNLFNRPQVQPAQTSQSTQTTQPAQSSQTEPQKVTSQGSNVVPEKTDPQKQKPEPVTQSGPIKQLIGNSPVVQGIAGAIQRIGQAIIPNKPRDDVKSADAVKDEQEKGGILIVKPKPQHSSTSGDNNDVDGSSGSGIEEKKTPAEIKEQLVAEPVPAPDVIKEQPAEPTKEVPDKKTE